MLNLISSQASKLIQLANKNNAMPIESKTKVITITSGKGGVGKSTITANMAYLLAQQGYEVAVLDADIGLANMQVLFNIQAEYTIFDYINGKKTINDIILETKYKNIYLLAGKNSYKYTNNINSFVLSSLVKKIISLNKFDFLLIDTGAGLNNYVKEFLMVSDNILALTTTDPSALTDIYSLMNMMSYYEKKLFLCFNHTKNYQIGSTITKSLMNLSKNNRLNENFMVKYIGNVSTSANISTTGRLRKIFVNEFEGDVVSKQLAKVLEYLKNEVV